jgi:hypothetical protein
MTDEPLESLEKILYETGKAFPYPPTPDISRKVAWRAREPRPRNLRRLAWVGAILILLIGVLFAVPPVRARILDFIQVGAVRIFLSPTSTPSPLPATPSRPASTPVPTSTLAPTPTLLPSLLDLAGKTTLAEARRQADFQVRLPAYPADLGPPDYVFLQNMVSSMVVLVWTKPDDPNQVWLSLDEFGPDAITAKKMMPPVIQTTTVNGHLAYWTSGPYLLELQNGDYEARLLVEGHTLIWEEGDITYRLETSLPLDEAVKIAESLR